MSLEITPCSTDQLDMLQALAKQTFINNYRHKNKPENFEPYLEKAFNTKQLRAELQNPASAYYLIYFEAKLIGYIKLNEGQAQTESHDPLGLELERIYILKTFQGKGFGRQLLNFCLDQAKAKQKTSFWLGVWDQNHDAIQFYKKCGLQKFGEHIFQLGDEAQIDYLMKIDLV